MLNYHASNILTPSISFDLVILYVFIGYFIVL